MFRGGLIAESIRVGARLADIPHVITQITRSAVSCATPDQPSVWTLIEFEVEDSHAGTLA